jgi:putative membrane protein
MWSFFFGLVLASAGSMLRQIQLRSIPVLLTLFLGMILGVALQRVLPTVSDPSPLLLFFGGAIAVCAWILPGVSGSFLLLLLGLYGGVIDAVARVDIIALLPFALGAGIGLVLFANLLRWLFDRLRSYILAFLIGLMMGTLTRLWPWQQVVQYQLHADGLGKTTLMQEPISPIAYQALTGESAELLQAVVGVVLGALLILLFEAFARSRASER